VPGTKKRTLPLLLLLVGTTALTLLALTCKAPLEGHISSFLYRRGHAWFGYYEDALTTEGGAMYATRAFVPADSMADPQAEPWQVRTPLTEGESAAFDALVLQTLRLPEWEDYYEPEPEEFITDQDDWTVLYTWDGAEHTTGGYYVFPEGLAQISAFFDALTWPAETP